MYKHNIDNDDDKEVKLFKGKHPKEVAKKVVTEVCRLLKLSDPKNMNICKPVTLNDIEKRDKFIHSIKEDWHKVDIMMFPGFLFELEDIMNKTFSGQERKYLYYGERVLLDNAKNFKGSKFIYEAQVLPIRKGFTFEQAVIDHGSKSSVAKSRYQKTQNFEKRRRSRSLDRNLKNKILNMSYSELMSKCLNKGGWKLDEINNVLDSFKQSKDGNKNEKCKRIISFYKSNSAKFIANKNANKNSGRKSFSKIFITEYLYKNWWLRA